MSHIAHNKKKKIPKLSRNEKKPKKNRPKINKNKRLCSTLSAEDRWSSVSIKRTERTTRELQIKRYKTPPRRIWSQCGLRMPRDALLISSVSLSRHADRQPTGKGIEPECCFFLEILFSLICAAVNRAAWTAGEIKKKENTPRREGEARVRERPQRPRARRRKSARDLSLNI